MDNSSNAIPINTHHSDLQINHANNIPSASIPIKASNSRSNVDPIHRASSLTNCMYNNSGSFGSPYNIPEFMRSSTGSYSIREKITSDEIYTGTIIKFSRSKGHGYLTIDTESDNVIKSDSLLSENLDISKSNKNSINTLSVYSTKSSLSESMLLNKVISVDKIQTTASTEEMLKKVIPHGGNRSNARQQILNLHNFDDNSVPSIKNCPVLSSQINSSLTNDSIGITSGKISSHCSSISEGRISDQVISQSINSSVIRSNSRQRLNNSTTQNCLKNFSRLLDKPLFFHVGELQSDYVPQNGDKCTFQTITVPPKVDELQATNINIILDESEISNRKTWRDI